MLVLLLYNLRDGERKSERGIAERETVVREKEEMDG